MRDATYSQVRAPIPPVYFIPYRQDPNVGYASFYVRTALDENPLSSEIRPIVSELAPNLPVTSLRTMTQQIEANTAQDRLVSVLSASFAVLATLLAAIGLYGVLAFTVSQRTREFGLRMAHGATPSTVRRIVLRSVLRMTLAGAAVGLGLAVYVARLDSSLLFRDVELRPGRAGGGGGAAVQRGVCGRPRSRYPRLTRRSDDGAAIRPGQG